MEVHYSKKRHDEVSFLLSQAYIVNKCTKSSLGRVNKNILVGLSAGYNCLEY